MENNGLGKQAIIPSIEEAPRHTLPEKGDLVQVNCMMVDCGVGRWKILDGDAVLWKWSEREKEIFEETFKIFPKKFRYIASRLKWKTVGEVMQYYYLTKRKPNQSYFYEYKRKKKEMMKKKKEMERRKKKMEKRKKKMEKRKTQEEKEKVGDKVEDLKTDGA